MLCSIGGSLVAAAAPSVKWTCSVEGDEWQDRPIAAPPAASAGSPQDICSPMPSVDCWGHDMQRHTGVTPAAACCTLCKSVAGCGAWTFDTTRSHGPLCYIKSSCGQCSGSQCTTNVTAVSGSSGPPVPTPPPSPPPPPTPPPVSPNATLRIAVNTTETFQTIQGWSVRAAPVSELELELAEA